MSSPRFEAFLARLYTDPAFASRFLERPAETLAEVPLDERERQAALDIDPLELTLAGESYAAKRRGRGRPLLRGLAHKLAGLRRHGR